MQSISRRMMVLGLGATGLAGCVGGGGRGPVAGATADTAPRAVANPAFDAWVAAYRTRAAARGIPANVISEAMGMAGYLPDVIEKDRNQTEFTRTLEDYLAIAAKPERVAMGQDKLRQYGSVLARIEARYGVEPHVVAAVWGLESFFGTRRGVVPVVSALATLAYDGRRGEFFESQLTAALKIIANGDVSARAMTGSWAGAMGHTQFIPTSYLAFAVDFTGDGKRDIWSDDPTDSLASTAAYLQKSGWQRGLPWGAEVRLPAGFDPGHLGRGKGKSAAEWSALGVTAVSGGPVPAGGSIIAPKGVGGPAFLLTQNFNVILRYNNAENYAIGVGHLSDRLLGRPGVQADWGPDKTGLTMADRQALQQALTRAGYDTGGTDGVMGAKTKAAIAAYQQAAGLPVTGEPSLELLRRLR
ncbi:MAG: lytic murein transglycosylase [Brevundimonas sp.]|uniref:lytic murein transglycosylase n=1 Tax=Brevundimonas sp. TaxID=1871086 RepID=UPI0027339720|nr:lytic murein transglycosylase [Brevundimonas sp.]MDP3377291.1 lytic murein transglycosylase [Brevundimonas sp.]